ncbi:MAG: GNAT family N-acetyltransferase [Paracoccaceae bacterium]
MASSGADVAATQRLRHEIFVTRGGGAERPGGLERDRFDATCRHVLVEDRESGRLACCFRFLPIDDGAAIARSYSAQFYDLSNLTAYRAPMVEFGRFCVRPGLGYPDVMRIAWAAMAHIAQRQRSGLLFGCASFSRAHGASFSNLFAMPGREFLAPARWRPGVKAREILCFGQIGAHPQPDRRAWLGLPPLLRAYLGMGGWLSDHAVVDRELNTLHVFVGLEVHRVPAGRARNLRRLAGLSGL